MGVSKNNCTPKSSILIGFSIINHPFWGTTLVVNTHIPSSGTFLHHLHHHRINIDGSAGLFTDDEITENVSINKDRVKKGPWFQRGFCGELMISICRESLKNQPAMCITWNPNGAPCFDWSLGLLLEA